MYNFIERRVNQTFISENHGQTLIEAFYMLTSMSREDHIQRLFFFVVLLCQTTAFWILTRFDPKKRTMNSSLNNRTVSPVCTALMSLHEIHIIILTSFVSVLCILTVSSNTVLIYSLYKTQLHKNFTTKFVIATNLSDLLTRILVLPLWLIQLLAKMKNDQFATKGMYDALHYLGYTLGYFSGFMLFAIARDRYLHMTTLNSYNSYMNYFKMKIIITSSLVLSIIIALVSHLNPSFYLHLILNGLHAAAMICAYYFYYTYGEDCSIMH